VSELHVLKNMKIRPYKDSDERAIIKLWAECGLIAPKNNPIRDIQRKLKVNPDWFLVGQKENEIIASCMVGYEGHRGWINYLAVTPSEQRKGYARLIMEEAECLLREAGCPKINLQVRSTNSEVIAFYESIGFSDDHVTSLGKRLETDEPHPIEP
jgi:ribosomal protein S18 acetylase RimI-like enzyme